MTVKLSLSVCFYSSQKDGFEQGKCVGRSQGETEGNRLGWEKGAAIGSEVNRRQ